VSGDDLSLAYIDTPGAAHQFLEQIVDVPRLALDTEGASFHRFVDRIYLLQITTAAGSAIIDPLAAGPLGALGTLLENRAVEVVFHDADYDLRLLHQDYTWRVTNIFDTRIAAQLLGLRAFGLAALLERYFGVRLDKKHQRADWSMRPLTPGMLDYAAQDTRYLLDLRDRLAAELRDKGRLEWAREEFQRLEGTQWPVDDPADAFLRLKGARDLTRRELALLRELVQWRDGVAAAVDRATFRVVGNEALLEVARLAPTTREALAAIRGMPRGIVEMRGADVLAAVQRGVKVPDAQLPRFPRAARWDRDPDLDDRVARLKRVRDEAAARLDLDPGLLCSRERLETIARRKPRSLEELKEVPGLRAWQIGELGSGLLAEIEAAGSAPVASRPREENPRKEKGDGT
jgi:ribonuclease D